jgi:molybdopterin converting factor subunit 1
MKQKTHDKALMYNFEQMKVKVLFFGITKDMAGARSIEMELPEKATVGSFKDLLHERITSLDHLDSIRIAVNDVYVDNEQLIKAGDEVALIPPVSGG